MDSHGKNSGSRRAGSLWGHNPGGKKKSWKSFVSRQQRRQGKIIARLFGERRTGRHTR